MCYPTCISKKLTNAFGAKNGYFLCNISQENVFYDILERKNALLGYKEKKLKKSKIDIFPKGLTNRFGPKIAIFWTSFFLGNRSQENVFYDILERKNAFLGYKNKTFKKSKRWHFSIGVNPWFRSKNGHFSNFFFLGNIGQENLFYDILERKNVFWKHLPPLQGMQLYTQNIIGHTKASKGLAACGFLNVCAMHEYA